jgi:hypothetical protein
MLNPNTQDGIVKTEIAESAVRKIETIQIEMEGIAACLELMHDAQEAGAHEQGDRMAHAADYLGRQVSRLAQEIEDALAGVAR